ncbi:bifunctional nuclease family protein [candidate division KSB1 bacterium]|nr:bifunctional nuclease family protein [candidate division KSB1 bacterium]
MIRVEVKGLFMTQFHDNGVILKEVNGNRSLPIIVGDFEAQSIALGLEKIKPPRPLTHDLILSLLISMGYTIDKIIVDELKNNTFFAKIILRNLNKVASIDARPSDAIALAVRTNAPVFVADDVMSKASIPGDVGLTAKHIPDEGIDKLTKLKLDLKRAVEKEDYEKAAKLRDEIKKLGGEQEKGQKP